MKNREKENSDGFSVALCCHGTAVLRTAGMDYAVKPGCVMVQVMNGSAAMVRKSQDYLQKSVSVSLDTVLDFPSPVDIDIINLAIRFPVSEPDTERRGRLMAYYDLLDRQDSCTPNAYRKEIARSVLYALILEICDLFRSMAAESADMPKPKQEALTDDFFRLLAMHYRQEHTVEFYAGRLNRTPKYLSGAIRKLTGRSVPEWIASNLVREAKNLLKASDRTVLEVSEELNFSSPSVFVQFFRRNTGLTPLQYRRQG